MQYIFPSLATVRTEIRPKKHRSERGQAAVFLVLALAFFLIGGVGLAVDGGNMWFHRQTAQTAADAACTAGAMDMLSIAAGANLPNTAPTSSATSYAKLNGYSSGVTPSLFNSFGALDGKDCDYINNTVCDPRDNNLVTTPYLQVNVTDPVPTTFMRFVGANPTVNVTTPSTCGLSNVLSPVPVLVLNPNGPIGFDVNNIPVTNTLKNLGTFSVSGAPKSVQVNSTNDQAVDIAGPITLDDAVGDGGGQLAVAGQESAELLSSGKWVKAAGVISDPFAMINVSNQPVAPIPDYGTTVCPGLPAGTHCDYYHPGLYPAAPCPLPSLGGQAAICIGPQLVNSHQIGLAVFEPGVYYLEEDFFAGQSSCVRSATGFSDGGGSFFYLSGKAVLNVTSDSGTLSNGSFSCASTPLSIVDATCPGGNLNLPVGIAGFTGNVLLAPCNGRFGDPSGSGKVRGMLFFQNRNLDVQPHPALWSGSSSFALVGNVYLHHCHLVASGDSGANCDPNAFQETLNLGSNGYIVGGIVVDQLQINPGADIHVVLNPNPQYYVLKASLLQ